MDIFSGVTTIAYQKLLKNIFLFPALLLINSLPLHAQEVNNPRPNIVFITTDQQSADAMSFRMGTQWINTPNMDELASEGVFFTHAYAANPICAPCRNSIVTGLFPHQTGVQTNQAQSKGWTGRNFKSMGTYFNEAGYETAYFGKWHLNYEKDDEKAHGFQKLDVLSSNKGGDNAIAHAVDTFLQSTRKKPFLLWVSFRNPHDVCQWSRFQELPEGPITESYSMEQWPPMKANFQPPENETEAMKLMRTSYHQNSGLFPVGDFSVIDWRRLAWGYYRIIEKLDSHVGQVMEAIKANGYDENTLVVFTSDHGECLGAHGFNQKTVFSEESSGIPLIVRYNGKINPGMNKTLVNIGTDILPTLLDYARIEIPGFLPGISLKDVAEKNKMVESRSYIVVQNQMAQGGPVDGKIPVVKGRMVRSARYKYCLYDTLNHREALFDLELDPGETVNIAGEKFSKSILAAHREYLGEFAQTYNDTMALEMLDEVAEFPVYTQKPWKVHTIDDSSFGADGTRLCYANQDSLPDVVTGWEQGGLARLYFNPGQEKINLPWPYVEVSAADVEDAFVVDIDNDGFKDIVTLSEGEERRIIFHWAPANPSQYEKSIYWQSEVVPVTVGRKWMFGIPMDIDHKNGIDLVVGSKKQGGTIGWLESPENPREVSEWKYHEMSPVGWTMSIEKMDVNRDGHDDILISDRRGGDHPGVRWLENPGPGPALYKQWKNHLIGMDEGEPMFLNIADLNGDGLDDIIVPQNKIQEFVIFIQSSNLTWERADFDFPQLSGERGKSVAVGDIDGDGNWDVVSTYEKAEGKAGVMWTSHLINQTRKDYNVSGPEGKKFDLVLLLDMDGDGDLDILTSEENNNSANEKGLGVVWYENPSK